MSSFLAKGNTAWLVIFVAHVACHVTPCCMSRHTKLFVLQHKERVFFPSFIFLCTKLSVCTNLSVCTKLSVCTTTIEYYFYFTTFGKILYRDIYLNEIKECTVLDLLLIMNLGLVCLIGRLLSHCPPFLNGCNTFLQLN